MVARRGIILQVGESSTKGAEQISSHSIYIIEKTGAYSFAGKGHQLWQGGRARAFPHIKPVEEWCNKEFERRVKARLGK